MDFGFIASAWQRSGLALLVVAMAAGLVLAVEYPRENRAPTAPATPASPQSRATLRLESSFPVGVWSVSVAGVAIPASHSDVSTWQGVVEGSTGSEILIEATGEPTHAQRGAVRMVLDGDPLGERSAWGEGHVITTVNLP